MAHDSRIIPLDSRPRSDIESWTGESRGRWEGDTLVVETTNFSDRHAYRGSTRDRHLAERFTRIDADTLLYEFTISDPATWAAPWTAQIPMQLNPLPLFEYACHEGNYAIPNILEGVRVWRSGAGRAGRIDGARRAHGSARPRLSLARRRAPSIRRLTATIEREGDGTSPSAPRWMWSAREMPSPRRGTTSRKRSRCSFEMASAEETEGRLRDEVHATCVEVTVA